LRHSILFPRWVTIESCRLIVKPGFGCIASNPETATGLQIEGDTSAAGATMLGKSSGRTAPGFQRLFLFEELSEKVLREVEQPPSA
jgi:hypothetical protein